MKKNILLLCIALLTLNACNTTSTEQPAEQVQATETKLTQAKWLLGSWEMNTQEVNITEDWQQSSDNLYRGTSFVFIAKGDTLFAEQLSLLLENDTLYYIPIIKTQNDGKEVRFKEASLSADKMVFENLQHDFPQRIVYQKTSDTTIYAYVEGMQDGKMKKEEFAYSRR